MNKFICIAVILFAANFLTWVQAVEIKVYKITLPDVPPELFMKNTDILFQDRHRILKT